MAVNLIFCFLKLAKQIKFQFISVEYCILSPSYYPSEYVSWFLLDGTIYKENVPFL